MARYMTIRARDISDGPGIRIAVYFQGCPYHCPGCWNSESWDPTGGDEWSREEEDIVIELAKDSTVVGLSLLGGEPLYGPTIDATLSLVKRFKETYPDKNIWIWSGNTFEKMSNIELDVLKYCDVLVDGPFILEKRDVKQRYAGSTNQRVIDLKKTFNNKELTLWEGKLYG